MSALEQMWAPWRMAMIRAPKTPGCFLCDKHEPATAAVDRDNLVLERGCSCYCLMNLYPYTNGHLLVAPYRHTGDLAELTPEELAELMTMTQTWTKALKLAANPQGFNLGMNIGQCSGAGCAGHLHMHIVPRWNGDTNFMTIMTDVRVINQDLLDAYDELLRARASLS